MKLLYKKVLQNLLKTSYLVTNLYLDDGDILDELQSNCVFDVFENEDISREKTSKQKVECIVQMLIVKRDDQYESFKKCLEKKNKHVVEKMSRLEIELEKSCQDCCDYIDNWLIKNYEAKHGSVVDFVEIQHQIIRNIRECPEHHDTLVGVLDETFLLERLRKTFPTSKKEEQVSEFIPSKAKKKNKNKNKSTRTYTKNVIRGIIRLSSEIKRPDEDSSSESDSFEDDEDQSFTITDLKKLVLNDNEFSQFVERIFSANVQDWDKTVPQRILEQKIDSEVYDMLTKDEKIQLIPRMGERIRIDHEWEQAKKGEGEYIKEIKSTKPKGKLEHLRRFDKPSTDTLKYTCNNLATTRQSRSGNLIYPIRKYFMLDESHAKQSQQQKIFFFDEAIKFAAACLNERSNGTFHYGIKSSGEISGCVVEMDKIDLQLTNAIRENFKEYQVETVLKCIRPPQFVEVIGGSKAETKYVIELDVVPFSGILGSNTFYVKGKKKSSYLFYRYINGEAVPLESHAIEEFMATEHENIVKQRIEAEKKNTKKRKVDLHKRLKDFLCCGEDEFEESLYPVLVLSTLQNNQIPKLSQSELLSNIPWRTILDFNSKDEQMGFQQLLEKKHSKAFLTHTVEDFNPRYKDEKSVKRAKETIEDSPVPTWIYCNEKDQSEEAGSGVDKVSPADISRRWNAMHFDSFRQVVDFYYDTIPDGRCRIVIPLYEKENTILSEAIIELIRKFGKQCIILSPSKSIAWSCRKELEKRQSSFPQDCTVDDCFMIGLPWGQVNESVSEIVKLKTNRSGIKIPRSNGVNYTLEDRILAELSDLDIVGINTCSDIDTLENDDKLLKEQEAREDYYGGGIVKWENFYYKDQVLRRDVHRELDRLVKETLDSYDNDGFSVQKVVVYHQPGSGGTTTSRQVLWDFRQDYRCCVVKKITNQTCDQIGRFRTIGEEAGNEDIDDVDVKPVLVLLDDNNEDRITQFVEDLERENEKYDCDAFCVLLICFRVSALPLDKPENYVMLRQELSTGERGELNWFKEKYDSLLKKYQQKRGCHPHTLLALNIMKENFNMESIKESLKAFVCDDLVTPKHLKMLKFLSFFNTYDLQFQSIPVSCFDSIMAPPVTWVRYLPSPVRVLTSKCRRQGYGGYIQAIRMSNYLLSKSVLEIILETEIQQGDVSNTIGEVALDILESDCFRRSIYKYENKILRNILGDISKKRDREQTGGAKLKKFSPLIMELLDQGDSDQAIKIVSKIFDLTCDPLVAQQLSRLNAELGNWKEAHKAIEEALDQRQNNSFLMHTKGQLYKEEMLATFSKFSKESMDFPISSVNDLVEYTKNAIDWYRKCQKESEIQDLSQPNPAGYESEILITVELIRFLRKCPLLKSYANVANVNHIQEVTKENVYFIKSLPDTVSVTIDKLERILHGTNRHLFHSSSRSVYTIDKKQLDKHKNELVKYFTAENTHVSNRTKEIAVTENVWSFLSAFRFNETDVLMRYIQAVSYNIESQPKSRMRVFLAMCLSISLSNPSLLQVRPEALLSLSRRYYETLGSTKNDLAKLESYLYFTIFHWPLSTRKQIEACLSPYSAWSKAVQSWLEYEKQRTNQTRRNDRIFFYLGKSYNFPGLIKLESPSSVSALEQFKGLVNHNASEIEIEIHSFRSEHSPKIRIPFFKPLGRCFLQNRKIENVIIGFGLNGPRADYLDKPSSFRHQSRFRGQHRYSRNDMCNGRGSLSEQKEGLLPIPRQYGGNTRADSYQQDQHNTRRGMVSSLNVSSDSVDRKMQTDDSFSLQQNLSGRNVRQGISELKHDSFRDGRRNNEGPPNYQQPSRAIERSHSMPPYQNVMPIIGVGTSLSSPAKDHIQSARMANGGFRQRCSNPAANRARYQATNVRGGYQYGVRFGYQSSSQTVGYASAHAPGVSRLSARHHRPNVYERQQQQGSREHFFQRSCNSCPEFMNPHLMNSRFGPNFQ